VSSSTALEFTRIVLGLDRSVPDRTTMRLAAELARLLRLDLFGLFAEDPRLASIAATHHMREFRMLERQWRPVEGRSLLSDLEMSASIARRAFDEATRTSGVSHRFEVVRARVAEAIASVSCATDILVLAEPRTPADRALRSFSEIVTATMTSPASVLIVPNRIAREHGPILAIVDEPDDPSMASATAIAAAANERVEIVASMDLISSRRRSTQPGERMIVMTLRASGDIDPSSVVSERHVPILVLKKAR
jgi:hypothetical protein